MKDEIKVSIVGLPTEISPHKLLIKLYVDLPHGMRVRKFELAGDISKRIENVLNEKEIKEVNKLQKK